MRTTPVRRGRRALFALLVAVLSLASVTALVSAAGAAPPQGPAPAAPVTIAVSPVDNLLAGDTVTYNVTSTGPGLFSLDAHVCETGNTPASYNDANFGFDSGDRCVNQPGITSGGLTGPGAAYEASDTFDGAVLTSGNQTIDVGTGTVEWSNNDGFPGSPGGTPGITCNFGNPCDLVFRVALNGAPPTVYFTQTLTFASTSPPGAPSALVASDGENAQTTVNWTAGTGAVTDHEITISPAPGAGNCASGTCLTGSAATNFVITGLTNFTTYTVSVKAVNTFGMSPASNTDTATPATPGPTLGAPNSGNTVVDLDWSDVAGATDYRITVTPAPNTTPGGPGNCETGQCFVGGPTSQFQVTGLTNGTSYTFTVAAITPGGTTGESNAVVAAPNANLITQTITVTRPDGVLVISQYCSGLPTDINGFFDPSNNNGNVAPNPVPLTNCNLALSGPRPNVIRTDAITPDPRGVTDAVTNGTTTITSNTIGFTSNDVNQEVRGDGIPGGTRIASVPNGTTAVLTNAATTNFDGGQFHIVGRTINFASPHGLTAGNEIEGLQIPGGSTITSIVSPTAVDVSQPLEDAMTGMTVRSWTVAPTPAHLITTGPMAGQFLKATGQLRQVMVVDTRPSDPGWTATGQVTDFCVPSTTTCFDGDNLGWKPKTVHEYAGPFTSPDGTPYAMAPTAGSEVLPGNPFGLSSGSTTHTATPSLGTLPGATLAYTFAGSGLGIAALDADLTLHIPVFEDAGVYQAVLTLTAV